MSVAEGGGGDYDDRAVSDLGVSSLSCMTVNTMTRCRSSRGMTHVETYWSNCKFG